MSSPAQPIVWVLREYPYTEHAGQHQWLRSMLASSSSAGFPNILIIPSGAQIPIIRREGNRGVVVRSPATFVVGGWEVARPRHAARRLAWLTYKSAPQPVQRLLADRRRARRGAAGVDHVLGRDWSLTQEEWLHKVISRIRPQTIVFDSPFTLTPTSAGTRRVVIAHDVIADRAVSLAAVGYRTVPENVDRAWESRRLATADAIIAIQWDEARVLETMAPGVDVVVAPPTFAWRSAPPVQQSRHGCLMVGSGSLHNVDALRWFLNQVWPLVLRAVPDAELRVVGTVCGQVEGGQPGVRLVGEVDDLAGEYGRASVVLVPLRAGSGLKVKLIEALCHGRAVVSTDVGAQGLSTFVPQPFVVANDPEAFARGVVMLMTDEAQRERLERAARQASRAFDPKTAHQALVSLLERLAA